MQTTAPCLLNSSSAWYHYDKLTETNKQNSAGNCHCLIDIVFIFQMQNNNRSPVMCNQAVGITSANQDPLSLTKKCTASSKEALIHKHLYHYTYHKQISHLVIRRNCNW